jgi:hypothetical protein
VSPSTALLAAAAVATLAALLVPATARWSWGTAALMVALAGLVSAGPLIGVPLLVLVLGSAVLEPSWHPRGEGFNDLLSRLGAAAGGAVLAILAVISVAQLGAEAVPSPFLVVFIAAAALLYLMRERGTPEQWRVARLGVVLAASAWGLAGHPGTPPSLGGLSRAAVLLAAWSVLAALLGAAATRRPVPVAAWWIPIVGAGLAVSRTPPALVALLIGAALLLRRAPGGASAVGWSRGLLLAAAASSATIAATIGARQHGDEAIAALLLLAFLVAAGMIPFGWQMVRSLQGARATVTALVVAAFLPGVVAALAAVQPLLTGLHQAGRAGLLLGLFGGLTAVAGGLHALRARDWHGFAVRTLPIEVGLSVVGLAAFDTRGLQAAALTLSVLALTRPALLFADTLGPRRGAGLVGTAIALVGIAGLPPTLGFPARLLVLGAAGRVHPAVAVLAVAGIALELAATAAVLRHRLAQLPPAEPEPRSRWAWTLSGATVLALVGGGVFPLALLRFGFALAG